MKTLSFLTGLIFLFFFSTFFLTSCTYYPYGSIVKEYDDFKNEKKTYVVYDTRAKALKTNRGVFRLPVRIILKYHILENEGFEADHTMHIETTTKPFYEISEILYIKTDETLHELRFSEINNTVYIDRSQESSSSSSTSSSTTTNSAGTNSQKSGTASQPTNADNTSTKNECNTTTTTTTTTDHTTKVSEKTLKNIRSQLIVSDELRKNLASAKKIQIRVYLDSNAYTIDLEYSQVNTLNKLLRTSLNQTD